MGAASASPLHPDSWRNWEGFGCSRSTTEMHESRCTLICVCPLPALCRSSLVRWFQVQTCRERPPPKLHSLTGKLFKQVLASLAAFYCFVSFVTTVRSYLIADWQKDHLQMKTIKYFVEFKWQCDKCTPCQKLFKVSLRTISKLWFPKVARWHSFEFFKVEHRNVTADFWLFQLRRIFHIHTHTVRKMIVLSPRQSQFWSYKDDSIQIPWAQLSMCDWNGSTRLPLSSTIQGLFDSKRSSANGL